MILGYMSLLAYRCSICWQEIHIEWGKGLVQKREAEARLKELEVEKSKPFARTRYLAYGAYLCFLNILLNWT
jgi:hypothetical protein